MQVVRNTRSPQTMGEDQPRPGTSAFQRTFLLVSQVTGKVLLSATPRCELPRKAGQCSSAPTGAGSRAPIATGPVTAITKRSERGMHIRQFLSSGEQDTD